MTPLAPDALDSTASAIRSTVPYYLSDGIIHPVYTGNVDGMRASLQQRKEADFR
jgi:hypothetical protein